MLFIDGTKMLKLREDPPTRITFGDNLLVIASDGFYVRGVKVERDAAEAEAVYTAFVEWLNSVRHVGSVRCGNQP